VGIAGVVGTLAPSLGVLVAARVLLGFGTCAGYPAAMYLIRSESARTGQDSPTGVLTALAVSTQTIAVIGPSLGGLLIGLGGWRTIFAVNIPLAVAGVILGWRRLPTVERPARTGRFDVPGMVLFAAALTSLLLFLMHPSRWYLVLLGVAVGAGFAVRELRAETAANGAFFGGGVDTAGLHDLAAFLVGVAVLFVVVTLVDRSLGRIGAPADVGLDLANQ
jgi:MFS family permease